MSFKTKVISAFILIICLVGAFFTMHFIENKQKNSAEYALQRVVKSIEKKDIKTFTKLVNTQKLSESILKEFLEDPKANKDKKEEKSFWGEVKNFGKTIQNRLSGYIKPELINSIESQMNTYVSTGLFTHKKDLTALYSNKPILEKMWIDLSGSDFTFLGFSNIQEKKEKATADILFKREDLNFSSSLSVFLDKTKDGWEITAIDNLGETLNQLEELKIKKIKSKNKAIQEKMDKSINIQNIEKSEGLTKGEFGEMRILLRVAFENTAKQDITNFKAGITFKTKEGQVLRRVKIEDNDLFNSGDLVEKSWPMTLSPLSKDDHTIFKAKKNDIEIIVHFTEIEFANGEKLKPIPLESE